MSARTFFCDPVTGAGTRRSVLVGLAGLAAGGLTGGARAAAPVDISGLVDVDGKASALAQSLDGRIVVLRGYFSPSVIADEFYLYEQPAAPCQLCGQIHDGGANLVVQSVSVPADISMLRLIEVEGRVVVREGLVRLTQSTPRLV